MRSKWKGNFLKKILRIKKDNLQFLAFTSSVINKSFLGFRVLMHLGNKYKSYKITKNMLGFRFGEFLIRKKLGKIIHFSKGKKKKLKKKL